MRKLIVCISLVCSLSIAAAAWPASAQSGTSVDLPLVGADRVMAPLTRQQLDSSERQAFGKLQPGSVEAAKFLHTRGFLRYARLVANKQLEPAKLPALPARSHWDRKYLSAAEGKIVDTALGLSMAEKVRPLPAQGPVAETAVLPAIDDQENMAPLKIEQLSRAERQAFAKLAPGSPEATKFLYTRGFLRYAKLVVDKKVEPARLPRLPARENWDRRYLSAEEIKTILDPALAMQLMLMMK